MSSYPDECTLCKKKFSGLEPSRQHFLSDTHRKKEELYIREIEGSMGHICHVCHVRCNSSEMLQNHYKTPRHLAMVEKSRETCHIESYRKENGAFNVEDGCSKEYDFNGTRGFCYVCQLELSSEQHAQQHLSGQKHSREKMRKEEAKGGNQLRCNVCDVTFSSKLNMEQHLAGKKHKKNEAAFTAINPTETSLHPNNDIGMFGQKTETQGRQNEQPFSPSSPVFNSHLIHQNLPLNTNRPLPQDIPIKGYVFDGNRGTCHLCNIDLTSKQHAEQHLRGSKHRKMFEQQKLEEKTTHDQKGKQSDDFLEEYYMCGSRGFCNVCQIELTSQQHKNQHIEGAKHIKARPLWHDKNRRKKTGEAQAFAVPGSQLTNSHCDVCNVRFSGQESAAMHFASEKHKNRQHRQEIMEKGTGNIIALNQDNTVWYTCDVCHCHVNSKEQLVVHKKSHMTQANHVTPVSVKTQQSGNENTRADFHLHTQNENNSAMVNFGNPSNSDNDLPPSYVIAASLSQNSSPWPSLNPGSLQEGSVTKDNGYSSMQTCEKPYSLFDQTYRKEPVMPSLEEIPKKNLNCLSKINGNEEKELLKPNINAELRRSASSYSENEEKISLELEGNIFEDGSDKMPKLEPLTRPKVSKDLSNIQKKVQSAKNNKSPSKPVVVQKTTDNPIPYVKKSLSWEKDSGSSSAGQKHRHKTQGSDIARATKNRPKCSRGSHSLNTDTSCESSSDSQSGDSESECTDGRSFSSSSSYQTCIGSASGIERLTLSESSQSLPDKSESLQPPNRETNAMPLNNSPLSSSSSPNTVIYKNPTKSSPSNAGISNITAEKNNLTINPFSNYKYYCPTCNRPMDTKKAFKDHISGRSHLLKVANEPAKLRSHPPIMKNVIDGYDESLIDVTEDDPREYQRELFQKTMHGDKICFLPTGTGKTLVACMTISAMLDLNPTRQILVVVNKVLLVIQQSEYIKKQIGKRVINRFNPDQPESRIDRELLIAALCGGQQSTGGVSLWKHDVIILTAAFLENLLARKILLWEDQSLVVFDEAHHCQKYHPYNILLKNYHLPLPEATRCKILGLTASPAGKLNLPMTIDMLRHLQDNMGGTQIAIVEKNQRELKVFQSNAQIIPIVQLYSKKESNFRRALQYYLLVCYMRLSVDTDILAQVDVELTATKRQLSDEEMHEYAQEICGDVLELIECTIDKAVPESKTTAKVIEVKNLISHIKCICMSLNALSEMGIGQAIEELQVLMSTNFYNGFEFAKGLGLTCEELLHAIETYLSVEKTPGYTPDQGEGSLAPRIDILISNLTNRERIQWPASGSASNNFPMALVLVKERSSAYSMCKLLQDHPAIKQLQLKVVALVGHGTSSSEDYRMSVQQQKRTLEEIRSRKYNIIIATAVAEEGLDLPECELVVAMNLPSSVTGLVQMRGRARKKNSTFIVICLTDKEKEKLEELQLKEENMIKAANFLVQSQNKPLSKEVS